MKEYTLCVVVGEGMNTHDDARPRPDEASGVKGDGGIPFFFLFSEPPFFVCRATPIFLLTKKGDIFGCGVDAMGCDTTSHRIQYTILHHTAPLTFFPCLFWESPP